MTQAALELLMTFDALAPSDQEQVLPNRGEVWLADLGIAAKVRPGLVLSVPPEPRDRWP